MDRRSEERRQESSGPGETERRSADRRTGPSTRRGILGQRTRFLVPGAYQLRAIGGVVGLCLLLLFILDFTIYRFQKMNSDKILQVAPELARLLSAQDRAQMWLVVLASTVGLLAVAAIAMFETHKTAGPLFSLHRTLVRAATEGGPLRV